jgi:hypothetical protein
VEPPPRGDAGLAAVSINRSLADALDAEAGDLVYVSDARRWLGGLRSAHATVSEITEVAGPPAIGMGPDTFSSVVTPSRADRPLLVERLY